MKLSDFLKQQGDTPLGKSVYQAFIDNFQPSQPDKWVEKGREFNASFIWTASPESLDFWDNIDDEWRRIENPENDMLWLLDGKELPSEQKEYPRWFKSTDSELVVRFDDLKSGEIIVASGCYDVGYYSNTWMSHTNIDFWQEVPNPELAPEDKIDNIDGKNHLDTILAERGAKYGSYKAQAKCVGDIILATQEVAKANGKQQTAEQIGSIAYLAIKIARYANGETGDTLDDLEGYAKRIREMERDNV